MSGLMTFLHIIAWIVGIGASIVLALRILGALTYSETDELIDKMNGVRRTWPMTWPAIISLICWAFIYSF